MRIAYGDRADDCVQLISLESVDKRIGELYGAWRFALQEILDSINEYMLLYTHHICQTECCNSVITDHFQCSYVSFL